LNVTSFARRISFHFLSKNNALKLLTTKTIPAAAVVVGEAGAAAVAATFNTNLT
jgi:hypothetical protein